MKRNTKGGGPMKTWRLMAVICLAFFQPLVVASPSLAGTYKLATQIALPRAPLGNFDISWVDAATQMYYLADRSNAGVDIVNSTENTFVARIGGFVGDRG